MVRAVEGIYQNGKVELSEKPEGLDTARVVVVFVSESPGTEQGEHKLAVSELLADLKRGYHLGGTPYLKREDLHDRADRS
jgi:hypothetical protein